MSYEIKWFDSDDDIASIPEELQEYFESPYSDRSVLAIFVDGELKRYHFDGGEPEDNSFGRDWCWVPDELDRAYKKGVEDGKAL